MTVTTTGGSTIIGETFVTSWRRWTRSLIGRSQSSIITRRRTVLNLAGALLLGYVIVVATTSINSSSRKLEPTAFTNEIISSAAVSYF